MENDENIKPVLGVKKFNTDGLPICFICGEAFHRVLIHVRQKHNMTALDYKKKFGLDVKKGIISEESKLKSRKATLANYNTVIEVNLKKRGEKTRFTKGHPGRSKEMMSMETLLRVSELGRNTPLRLRKINGQLLGKSGLGNKARWGTKE